MTPGKGNHLMMLNLYGKNHTWVELAYLLVPLACLCCGTLSKIKRTNEINFLSICLWSDGKFFFCIARSSNTLRRRTPSWFPTAVYKRCLYHWFMYTHGVLWPSQEGMCKIILHLSCQLSFRSLRYQSFPYCPSQKNVWLPPLPLLCSRYRIRHFLFVSFMSC